MPGSLRTTSAAARAAASGRPLGQRAVSVEQLLESRHHVLRIGGRSSFVVMRRRDGAHVPERREPLSRFVAERRRRHASRAGSGRGSQRPRKGHRGGRPARDDVGALGGVG